MIYAGYINIQLQNSITLNNQNKVSRSKDMDLLRNFVHNDLDTSKISLISKLQRLGRIQSTITFQTDVNCLVQIHIIVNNNRNQEHNLLTYSSNQLTENSLLLDLLIFVNRSVDPTVYMSPFDLPRFTNLLNIFIHLPSPHVNPEISTWCNNLDIIDFLNEDVQVKLPGMKTTLYNYQRHSLWKILQRELAPAFVEEYQTVKLTAVDNSNYYFNQLTGDVSLESAFVIDAKGGIICEDMGTGKTCICLAAIMATKDLSNLVDYHDKDLMTDMPKKTFKNIPSLKSLMAEKVLRLGINWKPIKSQLPMDIVELFQKYPMYYRYTDIPKHFNFERSRRVTPTFTTLTVYLSNATLVVVPDNLVAQWTGEIYKHIEDGQLRFLIYDDTKQTILPPIQLVDYDLIIISQSRFSYENSEGGLDFKSQACQCPNIWSTGEKACICSVVQVNTYVSPLLQIHWKRLIVDEGHRLSSKNRQSELSAKLFSNWKWICTGTPTQNLTESASMRTRQESQLDDLSRLGALYGQVLGIEPFKSNKKLWYRMFSKPFIENKPWAITKLTQIMEHTMIRNQRADMDKEVTLPPLYQNTIYLDFDYYQWMAHNCQIAMISLNAILSQREGPDYLFSTKNAKALRETVHNLWQSCLWFSIDLKQLEMAYSNCIEKCKDVETGKSDYGEENKSLLEIAHVLKQALDDKMFLCMMTQHSPSYVVQGLPMLFKESWGWLNGDRGAYIPIGLMPWDDHCVIQADRVVDAMSIVVSNKQNEQKELFIYNGANKTLISVEEYEANEKKKTYVSNNKKKMKIKNNSNNETANKTLPGQSSSVNEEKEVSVVVAQEVQEEHGQFTYYTRNAFSDARVLCSSSVKINYLVNQICRYQSTEKCIIFAQHYNEMYEIYLALQLAKVRVLMYQDSRMNNAKRSQMILTFNTSENANVIIMAVQKAAYGIDLSSATRVFFVSPVWQTAMEQQAIKRAHRIGQTRPVYIETLVIKNTIEDRLLKRREQVSKDNEQELQEDKENLKRGDFFTDSKLRDILNHAHFVPVPDTLIKDKNGQYYQKIVPLEAPLEFVPLKYRARQASVEENTFTATPSSVELHDDVDIEFSEDDDAMRETPETSVDDSIVDIPQNTTEPLLDIEGDDDAMDRVSPWKIRLTELRKPSPLVHQEEPTDSKRKRLPSESPPPVQTNPNKKKKSVRFA